MSVKHSSIRMHINCHYIVWIVWNIVKIMDSRQKAKNWVQDDNVESLEFVLGYSPVTENGKVKKVIFIFVNNYHNEIDNKK